MFCRAANQFAEDAMHPVNPPRAQIAHHGPIGSFLDDDKGMETTTLYRPVGKQELDLIRESGWKRFPPRLPFQPIFYPVLTEDYAPASLAIGIRRTLLVVHS
jgi:hypothetical protein